MKLTICDHCTRNAMLLMAIMPHYVLRTVKQQKKEIMPKSAQVKGDSSNAA